MYICLLSVCIAMFYKYVCFIVYDDALNLCDYGMRVDETGSAVRSYDGTMVFCIISDGVVPMITRMRSSMGLMLLALPQQKLTRRKQSRTHGDCLRRNALR